jgi:hypothetical protein
MSPQHRTRLVRRGCPRCHGDLFVVEESVDVAGEPYPLGWGLINRRCVSGCLPLEVDYAARCG